MNNEIINSVRKNTEMSFNKSIFDFFMNKYLEQDMTSFSTEDGLKLFDFIKLNKENASPMNIEDYKVLVSKVIDRKTRSFIFRGMAFDKIKVRDEIIQSLNGRNNKLTFDTEELYGKKPNGEKDILLYFDIAGKDIINVLTKMVVEFDKKDLAYDIEIPSFRDMENGHTDAIRIATSVENLKSIVDILEVIKNDVQSLVKDNDYARSNWFGINTIKDGKKADQVIGSSFIKALDTTLAEVSSSHPDLTIDGKSLSDYMLNETNKDLARQTVYKKIAEVDNTLGDKVYELILLDMKELGLDPDNMYVFDTVNEKLNTTYGPLVTVGDELKEEDNLGGKLDQFVKTLDEPKKDDKGIEDILSKLEMPTFESTEPTKEIPPIPTEALNPAPEESVETGLSHDVEPMTTEDEIVDTTMNKVGNQVNDIITNAVQSDVAKTIANLTPEEKVSMAQAIDQTQETLEVENKYLGLLDGVEDWSFDSKVKDIDGNPISLLEYLEKNNALQKVPFNSLVTLLDGTTPDGKEITGKKFLSKYVLDSLRLNESSPSSLGGLTIEEIMEKYIEKVELPEYGIIYPEGLTAPVKKDKNGLLKKLFKK